MMTEEEYEKLKNIKVGIPFKEFLDGATNLLTIFGILTGLIIFSQEFKEKIAGAVLTGCLFILSIIVLWEILKFTFKSDNHEDFKYSIFTSVLFFMELAFVFLFIEQFPAISIVIFLFFSLYGTIGLLMYVFTRIIGKYFFKYSWVNKKNTKKIVFALFLISMPIALIVFKLMGNLLLPYLSQSVKTFFNNL